MSDSLLDVAPPEASGSTLPSLRRTHSALLQRQLGRQGDAKPSLTEVTTFLEQTCASGAELSLPDERELAQGMLDYWSAVLLSQQPEAASGTRPFFLEPFDPTHSANSLAGAEAGVEDPATLGRQAEAASGEPAERHLLSCFFVRLVRLKAGSLEPYTVPVPTGGEFMSRPGVPPLLEGLVRAGALELQPEEDGRAAQYLLRRHELLTEWKTLREFVAARKAFRELARGWERSGRAKAALLTRGPNLRQAMTYRDLDDVEDQFISESRQRLERARSVLGLLAILAVVVLVIFLVQLSVQQHRLKTALREQRAALDNAEALRVNENKLRVTAEETLREQRKRSADLAEKSQLLSRQIDALKESIAKGTGVAEAARLVDQTARSLEQSNKQYVQQAQKSSRAIEDLTGQVRLPALKVLKGAVAPVTNVRFTSAQPPEVLAGAVGKNTAGALHLWTLDGRLTTIPGDAPFVRVSPDNAWVVTSPWKTLHAFARAENWKDYPLGEGKFSVAAFSPDGRLLAAANGGVVELRDWSADRQVAWRDSGAPQGVISGLTFQKSGARFASGSDDGTFRVWELEEKSKPQEGAKIWRQEKLGDPVRGVVYSAQDRWLLVRTAKELWVYPTSEPKAAGVRLTLSQPAVFSDFSPDGRWIAGLTTGGLLTLWHLDDTGKWQVALSVQAHETTASALAWSPDGLRLATSGDDGAVAIWDAAGFAQGSEPKPAFQLHGRTSKVASLQFSPDGRYLASGGDTTVRLWDFQSMRLWQRGRFKTFGGPNAANANVDEELALVRTWSEADRIGVFLSSTDRKSQPFVRQLDPDKLYLAARWDYHVTKRDWLLSHKVTIRNPATGLEVEAQPVDWGPGEGTGRVMDVSPGVVRALGLAPDGTATYSMPSP